jgi:hypothetical protein
MARRNSASGGNSTPRWHPLVVGLTTPTSNLTHDHAAVVMLQIGHRRLDVLPKSAALMTREAAMLQESLMATKLELPSLATSRKISR